MNGFTLGERRPQLDLEFEPYDHWVTPDGGKRAAFYRVDDEYIVRFFDEVDFVIDAQTLEVRGWPSPDCDESVANTLFQNAIVPILGNHRGGINLHGSSVAGADGAVAFLGYSRSGKTTLAGAFCQAGLSFLTEDVVELEAESEAYLVQPKPADFRLFSDSAAFLFGENPAQLSQSEEGEDERKQSLGMPDGFDQCIGSAPLKAMFLIGDGSAEDVTMQPLEPRAALTQLLQHSFILDVQDKPMLRAHFSRLADLVDQVPCFTLDYRRDYSELPKVVKAVLGMVATGLKRDEVS